MWLAIDSLSDHRWFSWIWDRTTCRSLAYTCVFCRLGCTGRGGRDPCLGRQCSGWRPRAPSQWASRSPTPQHWSYASPQTPIIKQSKPKAKPPKLINLIRFLLPLLFHLSFYTYLELIGFPVLVVKSILSEREWPDRDWSHSSWKRGIFCCCHLHAAHRLVGQLRWTPNEFWKHLFFTITITIKLNYYNFLNWWLFNIICY